MELIFRNPLQAMRREVHVTRVSHQMDDANAGPEEAAPGKVGEIANIVGRPVASYELACVTGHHFVGCLDNAGRGVLAV
jgi:hypothetical protein